MRTIQGEEMTIELNADAAFAIIMAVGLLAPVIMVVAMAFAGCK